MRYQYLPNDLLLIVALLKRSKRLSTVPDPPTTLEMSVRLPEALSNNVSASESKLDSRGSPSRGGSIDESILIAHHPKIVGGENVEDLTF